MVTYARDEIISASEMARGFATVLNDLKNEVKERFAISKNNKIEAVVLPVEEYERMKEAFDLMEHIEIYNIVKEREGSKAISLEASAKELGIDLDAI